MTTQEVVMTDDDGKPLKDEDGKLTGETETIPSLHIRVTNLSNGFHRIIRPLDRQNMQEPRVPELEGQTNIECNTKKLLQALQGANDVGDLVTFEVTDGSLQVGVYGESDSFVAPVGGELKDGEDCRSQYSLQYILPFVKAVTGGDTITVKFKDDYPLRLEGEYECGGETLRYIYFLAPRVDGE
jgi:hypothetical protein